MNKITDVTKVTNLVVDGTEYCVVKFIVNGKLLYGSIDRKFIRGGRLNKTITLLHLCSAATVEGAIESRQANIEAYKQYEKFMAQLEG